MAIIEVILLLVTLVILSNVFSHYLIKIPSSLIQISLGIIVASLFNIKIDVQTDWFMLLFIAPILFYDGNKFPKKELWAMKKPIIANAIFLVIVSTIVVGEIIHWCIPNMPLATSFALAAVLSPTDPIAVQSISKKAKLPDNLMHLVSGESLINDASGLICFKYGVAATVTGVFSLQTATLDFFYLVIIGVIVGIIMIWVIDMFQLLIYRQGITDITLHTIIQIITPIAIYFIAEELFHASGVVAVVVSGVLKITTGNKEYFIYSSELQVVASKTWDLAIYLLNGIVFVILGIELPFAMRSVIISDHSTFLAIGYAFLVWLAMLLVRTIWSLIYDVFSKKKRANFKMSLLIGMSGVRGAITMIGVLSLPLVVDSGAAFPRRTMILFIASGVIIISLLAATIFIPMLSKDSSPVHYRGSTLEENFNEDHNYISLLQAEIYITNIAIKYIENQNSDKNQLVVAELIKEYEHKLRNLQLDVTTINGRRVPDLWQQNKELYRVIVNAEKVELRQEYLNQDITKDIYKFERRKLFLFEKRLNTSDSSSTIGLVFEWIFNRANRVIRIMQVKSFKHDNLFEMMKKCERNLVKAGMSELINYLDATTKEYDSQVVDRIFFNYKLKIEDLKNSELEKTKEYKEQLDILRTAVLIEQRARVQDLYEQGRITRATASNLRTKINYTENSINVELEE